MNNKIEAWLRARDARRFQSDMDRSARSVRNVGDSADYSARGAGRMERANSRLTSVLGLLGRGAGYAVLGLGAVTAAGVGFGLKFNATMEQNEVAFKNFLGSAGKAKTYLDELYSIAARTPFEFPDLVAGARRLLAFGFEAGEAKDILVEIGDTAAGLGGGAEEINRMVMAIGQIQAKGKLSTEELLQMAELGVPAFQILKDEMGLTGKELETKLRAGAIGADKAIGMLRKGLRDKFKGMSADQAKTFKGQLSTLKDNVNKALGDLTKPLFDKLRTQVLPWLNKNLPAALEGAQGFMEGLMGKKSTKTVTTMGGRGGHEVIKRQVEVAPTGAAAAGLKAREIAKDVGGAIGKAFGAAKDVAMQLWDALEPAQPFLENVLWPFVKGVAIGVGGTVVLAFKIAIPIIKAFATVLGFIGKIMAPFKGIIQGVGTVLGFVFGGVILKAIGLLSKFGGVFGAVGTAAKVLLLPIRFVIKIIGLAGSAFIRYGKIGKAAILGVASFIFGIAQKIFMFLTWPHRKAAAFARDRFSDVVGFAKGLPGKIGSALGSLWQTITKPFKTALEWIVDKINWVLDKINEIKDKIPNPADILPDSGNPNRFLPDFMPGATGGFFRPGTNILVGEEGPEVGRVTSRGVHIMPLKPGGDTKSLSPITPEMLGPLARKITVPVYLKGREIARAVADDTEDREARG